MTWILPKQLHTLACALDTEALNLDLKESSRICEQSLFVRSKRLPLRTWLQKWKRDSWTRHLSGRILKPSLGERFVTKWASSLAVIHANHSAQQASEPEKMTQDIYGLGLQMELIQCDQVSVSLKMSKDISRWGCPTSSKTWEEWVTEQRGAYSARLKLARLINANGSSSWPTPSGAVVNDGETLASWEARKARNIEKHRNGNGMGTPLTIAVQQAIANGRPAPASPSTHGNRPELSSQWRTPSANEAGARVETLFTKDGQPAKPGERAYRLQPDGRLVLQSQTINQQVEMVEKEKRQSWATPRSGKVTDENPETWALRQAKGDVATMPLTLQVKQWRTPSVAEEKNQAHSQQIYLQNQVGATPKAWRTPTSQLIEAKPEGVKLTNRTPKDPQVGIADQVKKLHTQGKLNPRWVETLMGLPVGWTMPSCACPVTIEPTNSDSSEMA